jgi:hypothetical protein
MEYLLRLDSKYTRQNGRIKKKRDTLPPPGKGERVNPTG